MTYKTLILFYHTGQNTWVWLDIVIPLQFIVGIELNASVSILYTITTNI